MKYCDYLIINEEIFYLPQGEFIISFILACLSSWKEEKNTCESVGNRRNIKKETSKNSLFFSSVLAWKTKSAYLQWL